MRASEHALELLRIAMQIEQDGYAFYSVAATETKDSNAVKMFLSLARDEMEHLAKLETVYCALTKDKPWPAVERKSSDTHPRVFPEPSKAASTVKPNTRELTALKRGIQAEKDSVAFYQKAWEETADPEAQAMYKYLITEEEGHLATLKAEFDCKRILRRRFLMAENKDLQLLRRRRTIRRFTADKVSEEILEALLDAASVAPNRLDRRPLHYVVIRNSTTKTRIAEALRVRPYIEQAPIVIAVCANPDVSPTWELDGSAAIENMLLAATVLGLGGAWVGSKGSELWDRTVQVLRETVAIPDNIEVVSLACIGYPAEEKRPYEPGEKIDRQRVHYDHWDKLKL